MKKHKSLEYFLSLIICFPVKIWISLFYHHWSFFYCITLFSDWMDQVKHSLMLRWVAFQCMIFKQHMYPLCLSIFISCLIFYKILQAVLDTNLFKDSHMVDPPMVLSGIKLRFRLLLLVLAVWTLVLPGITHSPTVWHGVYNTCSILLSFFVCYLDYYYSKNWIVFLIYGTNTMRVNK